MPTGSEITDRIAAVLPEWLAWPASALASLSGFVGAGLILWAAAYGDITPALWSAFAFVMAAVLWHVAEFASDGSQP